jgi:hypothetical protein
MWQAFRACSFADQQLVENNAGVVRVLLKAKYLGAARTHADSAPTDAAKRRIPRWSMESGPLRKTVAVSKSKKKVIWSQG